MEVKNVGKILGTAALLVVGKNQLSMILEAQKSIETPTVSIRATNEPSLSAKVIDFVGTPQVRFANSTTTSIVGIMLIPSLLDVRYKVYEIAHLTTATKPLVADTETPTFPSSPYSS